MTSFSWLHFSDLHRGMREEAESWPRIKRAIFDDMRTLYPSCGPWNLVLFTGDLTYSGSPDQFKQVDDFLGELWQEFANLGHLESHLPQLLAVPGNHDLVWPENPNAPAVAVLLRWLQHQEVWEDFWELKKPSDYREVINQAFKNYSDWWEKQEYKPKNIHNGILPGDFSVTIENNDGAKLGVVGLNTSFLQLAKGNYYERLWLSSRQFHAACPPEGDKWVQKHHANLLMTHHPPNWLDQNSREHHLKSLIHTSNYFVVHLYGHEHETGLAGDEQGSGWVRRTIQAPSLFGLETYFNYQGKEVQRSHGYVASKIEFDRGKNKGTMTHWPRYRPGAPNRDFRLEADNLHCNLGGGIHTVPVEFGLRKPFDPIRDSSSYPDESHYDNVVKAIKEGSLVAILGSEVNLYGRGGQDDDEVVDWELRSKFPPTSRELALHLIQKFGLPHQNKKFRCPLCSVDDPEHKLPPKECWFGDEFLDENAYIYCPRMESGTEAKNPHMIVGRSPLHSSSQYANLTKSSNELLEELEKIFHVDKSNESKGFEYQTNPVLDFFARLPKSLKAKGFTLPYPLIITTNYDTALEAAFKKANQEYDLVFYVNSVKGKDQFFHRKPNGEIAPITDPNALSLGISFEERPVILKLYGTTDHMNENEGLVITEDNFIEYLVERNIDRLLHVSLKDKINIERNHLLFLGFGLNDWNHRIVLHRLWPNQQLKNCWSIQRVVSMPDQLDQEFWDSLGIKPLQISLKTYVDELTKRIDSL